MNGNLWEDISKYSSYWHYAWQDYITTGWSRFTSVTARIMCIYLFSTLSIGCTGVVEGPPCINCQTEQVLYPSFAFSYIIGARWQILKRRRVWICAGIIRPEQHYCCATPRFSTVEMLFFLNSKLEHSGFLRQRNLTYFCQNIWQI